MMDANKTPLGKPPPTYPKPNTSSSLLKPSYMSSDGGGYDNKPTYAFDAYQVSSAMTATSYQPPQPPKFTHYEYESYAVQPPPPPAIPTTLSFAGQFGTASNTQNKIVPSNYSKWDSPYAANSVKRENDGKETETLKRSDFVLSYPLCRVQIAMTLTAGAVNGNGSDVHGGWGQKTKRRSSLECQPSFRQGYRQNKPKLIYVSTTNF